ncbi:MAG: class I SAM-dependent methyltransferase [Candidatus Hydrothermarchaeaceae archaeon]
MREKVVPYHPTPPEKAREMLKAVGLKKGDILFDLGCGEGNILIVGAEEFGARCIGIEIDEQLANKARERVNGRGLDDRVTIICDDIFSPEYWSHESGKKGRYAIGNADVVAIYLNQVVHEMLRPKLEKELKKGARVVSHEFYVYGWKELYDIPMIFVFEKGKSF